jgi:chromosome segregation ATPase
MTPSPTATAFSSHSVTNERWTGTLKLEIEEKQKLEKDNFDLKMKVYYLEDALRQVSSGASSAEVEELQSENNQLRSKLQENAIDLEHRNTLLVKAKGAIEALKGEMERIKAQLEAKTSKEHRLSHQLQSFSHDRENSDENLRQRITILETENRQLSQSLAERQEALHGSRVKLVSPPFPSPLP